MPDGSFHLASSPPEAPSPATPREGASGRRFGAAAAVAVALHAAAVLPFVLPHAPAEPPAVLDSVEVAPVPETAEPERTEPEPAEVAEAVEAVPPEPPQAAEPAPRPDTAQAAAPIESAGAEAPPLVAEAEPPPEPLRAEAPPGPAPPPQPETAEAEAPPEEPVLAALPVPPPAPPPPPSVRPAAPPPPRPTPPRPGPPNRPAAESLAAAAAPTAPPAPASAPPRPPLSYVGALLAALERHKEYPAAARGRQAQGTATLRFTLRRDGSVSAWRIERSAGDGDLDAAVERMVRRASPLPAPPPEMPGEALELVVPVRFALR